MIASCRPLRSGFFFLLGFITRKTAVLGSSTGQKIVRTTCARKKKPELFGITCIHISFWFGRLSKILDERKGFGRFFTRIFSCCPLQNSTSQPASPKTQDFKFHPIIHYKFNIWMILSQLFLKTDQNCKGNTISLQSASRMAIKKGEDDIHLKLNLTFIDFKSLFKFVISRYLWWHYIQNIIRIEKLVHNKEDARESTNDTFQFYQNRRNLLILLSTPKEKKRSLNRLRKAANQLTKPTYY